MLPRKPFRFLDFLYLFARAFWIPFVKKVGKGGKFIAKGVSAIATALWEDKVLTPSAYKVSKGIGVAKKSEHPYNWEPATIAFVKKVGKGGKFIALKAACVHVVHDGDKPHAGFRIDDFRVRADFNIVPAEA